MKVVDDPNRGDRGIATQVETLSAIEATKQSLQSIGTTHLKDDHETGQQVVASGEETNQHHLIVARFLPRKTVEILSAGGLVSGMVSLFFFFVVGDSDNSNMIICIIASVVLVFTAPYVVYQKRQLRCLGTMRHQQNQLRHLTNQFQIDNNMLSDSVKTMSEQIESLQRVEKNLDRVAKKSGKQIDDVVGIVRENDKLQRQIKDVLIAQVMSQVLTAIIKSDSDGNFKINAREVEVLVTRLNAIPGVQVNLRKFQKFLKSDDNDMSTEDLCGLARNLYDGSILEKDRIIKLVPNEILRK